MCIMLLLHKDEPINKINVEYMNLKNATANKSFQTQRPPRPTRRLRRFFLHKDFHTKSVAVVLAAVMAFSAFGANVTSIVNLLNVKADALDDYTYYSADFKLYDYYDDLTIRDGINRTYNAKDSEFDGFNSALVNTGTYDSNLGAYTTGYVGGATAGGGVYSSSSINNLMPDNTHPDTYFPLYLGFQHAGKSPKANGEDVKDNPTKYNYSLSANAQAITDTNGTKHSSAAQGLVNNTLTEDADGNKTGDITQGGSSNKVVLPYFNSSFLANKGVGRLATGDNDKFRFRKHTDGTYAGYYVFNSEDDGLVKRADAETGDMIYSAYSSTATSVANYERYPDETSSSHYGFYPLGKYNYGFGARFDIDFTMSQDGLVPGTTNKHMEFNFSGDDDVWVFIDGYLALDIGGAHGPVTGKIDFATGRTYVSAVKKNYCFDYSKAKDNISQGDLDSPVYDDISDLLNSLAMYRDPTKKHKLTVFYMERGRNESNCLITFNFEQADTLTVSNHTNYDDVNDAFMYETQKVAEREGIQYQLISNGGQNTQPSPDDGIQTLDERLTKTNPSDYNERVTISFMDIDSAGTGWSVYKTKQYPKGVRSLLANIPSRSHYQFVGWTTKKYDPVSKKIYNEDGTTLSETLLNTDTDDPNNAITFGANNGNFGTFVEDGSLYAVWDISPVNYTEADITVPNIAYGHVFMNTGTDLTQGSGVNNLNDHEHFGTHYFIRNYTSHYQTTSGTSDKFKFQYRWPNNSESTYPAQQDSDYNDWYFCYSGIVTGNNGDKQFNFGDNQMKNSFLIVDTNVPVSGDTKTIDYRLYVTLGTHSSTLSASSNDSKVSTSLNNMSGSVKGYIKEYLTLREMLLRIRTNLINDTGTNYAAKYELKDKYDAALDVYHQTDKIIKTNGIGEFMLSSEQSAKFTVQFTRDANIKVAPMGDSYLLNDAGLRMEDQSPPPQQLSMDYSKPLSTRYSTQWMMYDNQKLDSKGEPDLDATGVIALTTGYSPRTAHSVTWTTANNPTVIDKGEGSFLMDFVDKQADAKAFVDVYVDYYNTVLVGSLKYTKKVTQDALTNDPDKTYTFKVSFSNVFGGDSEPAPYAGTYTLSSEANPQTTNDGIITLKADESFEITGIPVDTKYTVQEITASTDTVTKIDMIKVHDVTITEDSVSGTINPDAYTNQTLLPINNFSTGVNAYEGDLYVSCDQSGKLTITFTSNPNNSNFTQNDGKYVYVINHYTAGDPIQIHYTKPVVGNPGDSNYDNTPFSSDYTVKWEAAANTSDVAKVGWSVKQTYATDLSDFVINGTSADCGNQPVSNGSKVIGTVEGTILASNEGATIDGAKINRDTISATGGDWLATNTGQGDDDVASYILKPYTSYTSPAADSTYELENDTLSSYLIIAKTIDKLYYSEGDDPSELRDVAISNYNANGRYSPTFGGAAGSAIDPNGYEEATNAKQTFVFRITQYANNDFTGATDTFYEIITFERGDISTADDTATKSKVLKIDPEKSYTVEEITTWSWKYSLGTPQASGTNTVDDNKVGKMNSFIEIIDGRQNAAKVTFINDKHKNDDQSKVEGDSDVAVNSMKKPTGN